MLLLDFLSDLMMFKVHFRLTDQFIFITVDCRVALQILTLGINHWIFNVVIIDQLDFSRG